MAEANDLIFFECERTCSEKCCTGSLQILPSEIKRYIEHFPLVLSFYAIKIHEGIPSELKRKLEDNFVLTERYNSEKTQKTNYAIVMEFCTAPKGASFLCPLYYNNSCTAHLFDKPYRCSVFPLHPLVSHKASRGALGMMSNACKGINTSGEGSIVWNAGNCSDEVFDVFFAEMNQQIKIQKIIIDIYLKSDKHLDIIGESINLADNGGGAVYTTIPAIESILEMMGVTLEEFVEGQTKTLPSIREHMLKISPRDIIKEHLDALLTIRDDAAL